MDWVVRDLGRDGDLSRRAGGRGVDRVLLSLRGRGVDGVSRVLRRLGGGSVDGVGWVSGSLRSRRRLGGLVVALGNGGNEASESSDGNGVTHFG